MFLFSRVLFSIFQYLYIPAPSNSLFLPSPVDAKRRCRLVAPFHRFSPSGDQRLLRPRLGAGEDDPRAAGGDEVWALWVVSPKMVEFKSCGVFWCIGFYLKILKVARVLVSEMMNVIYSVIGCDSDWTHQWVWPIWHVWRYLYHVNLLPYNVGLDLREGFRTLAFVHLRFWRVCVCLCVWFLWSLSYLDGFSPICNSGRSVPEHFSRLGVEGQVGQLSQWMCDNHVLQSKYCQYCENYACWSITKSTLRAQITAVRHWTFSKNPPATCQQKVFFGNYPLSCT